MAATLVALVFGAVQIGLVAYAKAATTAAANAGAEAASAGEGTDAAGQTAALRGLHALGALGTSPNAEVVDSPGTVTVKTSVLVASIMPFLHGVTVSAAFTMHKELPS